MPRFRKLMALLMAMAALSCSQESEQRRLYPAISGDVVGFIDASGDMAIEARYQGAHDFSEGLAAVRVGDRWGYVNENGELAIPARYYAAGEFAEGLAPVREMRSWKYIDTQGETRFSLPPTVSVALKFANGVAPVRVGDVWEFVNHAGSRIPGRRYQAAQPFSEGLAAVCSARPPVKWGYVDTSQVWIIRPQFDAALAFSEGLAPAMREPDGWGFIDRQGEWVIQPQYAAAGSFSEGTAAVNVGGVFTARMGASPTILGGHWKYIDRNDSTIVRVDSLGRGVAEGFQGGIARIITDGEFWYIDRQGRVIWRNPGS